jgi:hypothetical protein
MKALPILLVGGAAAYYLTQKKGTSATKESGLKGAGPAGSGIMSSGTIGTIEWRVMKMFKDNFTAQWKLPRDVSWNDYGDFETEADARKAVIDAIHSNEIPPQG